MRQAACLRTGALLVRCSGGRLPTAGHGQATYCSMQLAAPTTDDYPSDHGQSCHHDSHVFVSSMLDGMPRSRRSRLLCRPSSMRAVAIRCGQRAAVQRLHARKLRVWPLSHAVPPPAKFARWGGASGRAGGAQSNTWNAPSRPGGARAQQRPENNNGNHQPPEFLSRQHQPARLPSPKSHPQTQRSTPRHIAQQPTKSRVIFTESSQHRDIIYSAAAFVSFHKLYPRHPLAPRYRVASHRIASQQNAWRQGQVLGRQELRRQDWRRWPQEAAEPFGARRPAGMSRLSLPRDLISIPSLRSEQWLRQVGATIEGVCLLFLPPLLLHRTRCSPTSHSSMARCVARTTVVSLRRLRTTQRSLAVHMRCARASPSTI